MITGIGTPNSHSRIPRPIGCPYMAMELANHNPAMGGGLHPWMHWLGHTNPMTRSAADETDTIFPRCNSSAPPGFIFATLEAESLPGVVIMARTLVHLYDSYDSALAVARDLESAGIPEKNIGLLANGAGRGDLPQWKRIDSHGETAGSHASKDAGVGVIVGGGVGLLSGLGLLSIPGIGPVVGLGWLAAMAVGAATGAAVGATAGGLVGSLVAEGVPERDAHIYAESLRRGGTMIAVRVDEGEVPLVERILGRQGVIDLELRGKAYRLSGWVSFDPTAAPHEDEADKRQ